CRLANTRRYNELKEPAMPAAVKLFTIGHSTHTIDHILSLLARNDIKALVDVRRFPGSRIHRHFNRNELANSLRVADIEYHWLEALGGRRGKQPGAADSPNDGLHNESFRNHADYMLTPGFRKGI